MLLFASEVALRRLDGDKAKKKLDLIQFAAREVAETAAGAPQVVRGQPVNPGASRGEADRPATNVLPVPPGAGT